MVGWQSFMSLHLKLLDIDHPLTFEESKLRQIESHALIYLRSLIESPLLLSYLNVPFSVFLCRCVLLFFFFFIRAPLKLACEQQTHFGSSLLPLRKIASANPSGKTISVT